MFRWTLKIFASCQCVWIISYPGVHLVRNEVRLQVLHHAERAESLDANDLLELGITNGKLFILGIVQVTFLDDGPHLFDDLVTRQRVATHETRQLGRQLKWSRKSATFSLAAAGTFLRSTGCLLGLRPLPVLV